VTGVQTCALPILVAPAFAVPVDPAPDHIGVYFDTGATMTTLSVPTSAPFNAYVIITNPTATNLWGLELGYSVVVPPGFEASYTRLSATIPSQSVDLGNSIDFAQGDYTIGLASPMPSSAAVVFLTWQFVVVDDFPMEFFLGPAATQSLGFDLPAYAGDSTTLSLGLSSGSVNIPVATVNGAPSSVPGSIAHRAVSLEQCQPNPFNPRTTIWYSLNLEGAVNMTVHDLSGRVVATLLVGEVVAPGRHQVDWNGLDREGREVASGVYFYRIDALGVSESRQMTLVR